MNNNVLSLVINFTGIPLPILYRNGAKQYFGYAYSNKSNSFNFYDFQYVNATTPASVIIDFSKWIATNGSWDSGTDYDIYIDGQPIISTKKDIDKRGITAPIFSVIPSEGVIDFSAITDITKEVNIYDTSINVSNTYGFSIGDRILVKTDIELGDPPTVPNWTASSTTVASSAASFNNEMEAYGANVASISNMYYYGVITALSSNNIFVAER